MATKVPQTRDRAKAILARRRRRNKSRVVCVLCGEKTNYFPVGCWCWSCYAERVRNDRHAAKPRQPDREARIRYYIAQAEKELPLFTGGFHICLA